MCKWAFKKVYIILIILYSALPKFYVELSIIMMKSTFEEFKANQIFFRTKLTFYRIGFGGVVYVHLDTLICLHNFTIMLSNQNKVRNQP